MRIVILTAFNVSLTGKAIIWWRSKRDGINGITTWAGAKEALMQAFGDRRKKETSTTAIARMNQGTKSNTD